MSERIYACLIRLYPSLFRKEYTEEALQLLRDRFRDERGFFRRMRLEWDLLVDLAIGLSLAWGNCREAEGTRAVSAGGMPSFSVLEGEPLQPASVLAAGILTLTILIAFGFLMSLSTAYSPSGFTHRSESPVEAVLERLNRATSAESVGGGDARNAQAGTGTDSATMSRQSSTTMPPGDVPRIQTTEVRGTDSDRVIPVQTRTSQKLASGTPSEAPITVRGKGAFAPASRQPEATENSVANAGANVERAAHEAIAGQAHPENATKAMMQLFQSHDIVMFGEVHGSKQEYEWLCKLVRTPEFADHVDDIVVEFGNARYQKTVDDYVAGKDVPFGEVQNAWRNMVADTEPVSPVYGWLYNAVREANLQNPGKRVRLLMGSPPADWSKIRTAADLAPYEAERERWYAQVVKNEVLAKHRRALLIMGAWHFVRGQNEALAYELAAQQHSPLPPLDGSESSPGYIERELRDAGANPYVVVFGTNAIDERGDVDRRFDAWTAPVIVPLKNNWVGNLAAKPVLTGGHAPPIPITLGEQADALLYVAPCSVLKRVYLSRAELDGTLYGKEMVRRDRIELGHEVDFEYGEVPNCVK